MGQPSDEIRVKKWKEKSTITPDGHWRYNGAHSKSGHGQISFKMTQMKISRASAILFLGLSRFSNLHALHKDSCPYPDCWNPDCLYIGTESDNRRDFFRRLRRS